MRYTLEQVVDFCYEYKRINAFKNFDHHQVARRVLWATRCNRLYIAEDASGISLCGVAIAGIFPASKTIYIYDIVCRGSGFRTLISEYRKLYPNFIIKGKRNNKIRSFNNNNLWVAQDQQNTLTKIQPQ
jgi:hypothetical protein